MRNRIFIYGIIAILVLGLLTGRLNPIMAAVVAALPVLHRLMNLGNLLKGFGVFGKNQQGTPGGKTSRVNTKFLAMTLDHDSGDMRGEVILGPFAGRALDDLSETEMMDLLRTCKASDAQSAAVLEAYLDRTQGDRWRDYADASESANRPMTSTDMSATEALEILGLARGAKRQDIIDAHRRLMQKMHPDRGGSTYLASKINQAKDVLLDA